MNKFILAFITFLIIIANVQGQWEILNAGGVILSIYFVNDKVGWMVGDGTLLKTEDGGETWESLPINPKWNIDAIDFINENVGWCSGQYRNDVEGESYGIIIKSVDGGKNWLIQKEIADHYLNEIYAVDDNIIYSVGNSILKSSDGGRNWIEVGPDEENLDLYSVWFFNPDSGITAGHKYDENTHDYSGILYKTSNGGNSWKRIMDPNITAFDNLQFINDSTGYFLAFDENGKGSICFTSDVCDSWTIITESILSIECFNFFDYDKVCAILSDSLGNLSVMKSNNYGITWEQRVILPSGRVDHKMYFYNPNLGFILSVIRGGIQGILGNMVLNSKDGGNNWIIQQITYPFKDVYFTDKDVGYVSGGVSLWHGGCGNLFKTHDGGRTWISSFHSHDEVKSVFFLDPHIGFILSTRQPRFSGPETNIYKTINSGITWDEVYGDESDSISFYFAGKDIYFLDDNHGWIAGAGFHNDTSGAAFLNTMDGGKSWDASWIYMDYSLYNYRLNSVCFIDRTTGWVVGESGLIVKYTQQDQWQVQTIFTDLPLNDVFFSDEKHGWIAGGYFNEDNKYLILLKTTNGGATWEEIPNFNYQINDMFFKDSLHGWAIGNDTSNCGMILETLDGGNNWTVQEEGLSAPLNALHFKDGYGWAVGGNGLVLRTEDGTSWVDQSSCKTYPTHFHLSQNYPNPFNPITMINYQLPMTNDLDLSIYNILGQKVVTLVNKKHTEGSYEVEWDAGNLTSGVYLYKLKAGNFVETKKMILLK